MVQASDDDLSIELTPLAAAAPLWRPRPGLGEEMAQVVGVSAPGELAVYLSLRSIEAMFSFAQQYPNLETGGLLVGQACEDARGEYLKVVDAIAAHHAVGTSTSLTFTQEAWNGMLTTAEELYPDASVVGWYHTHPGLKVFLSGPDQFIHHSFFRGPRDIAVVLDLQGSEWAVFGWCGEQLRMLQGFWVYAEETPDTLRLPAVLNHLRGRPASQAAEGTDP